MTLPRPQGLLDVIILMGIAWGLLSGLRAGLARSLTSLAGVLAGWAVAALLTGQVLAAADDRWGVVDSLAGSLEQVLPSPGQGMLLVEPYRDHLMPRLDGAAESGAAGGNPGGVRSENDPPPPGDGTEAVVGPGGQDAGAAPAWTRQPLHRLLAWGIASALTFVLLFAGTRLVFALVGHLLHLVFDAAPLRPLNRLAGAVFGALRNGVVMALVLGLLGPAAALGPFRWLAGLVDASVYAPLLLRVFYMLNPWIFGAPPAAGA